MMGTDSCPLSRQVLLSRVEQLRKSTTDSEQLVLEVQQAHSHPRFGLSGYSCKFALVELVEPALLNDCIGVACFQAKRSLPMRSVVSLAGGRSSRRVLP